MSTLASDPKKSHDGPTGVMTTHVTEPPREAVEAEVSSVPSSLAPTSAARRSSARLAWFGLGAVGVLGVLVFWLFEALPFQDLPAHAGLIALRHRFADTAFE